MWGEKKSSPVIEKSKAEKASSSFLRAPLQPARWTLPLIAVYVHVERERERDKRESWIDTFVKEKNEWEREWEKSQKFRNL